MNILIVDDEAPARSRLTRLLNDDTGHQIIGEASNGEEALQQAQQLEPDVVLMDIRMPGMDGIEAARHLSHLEQPPAVIFTTAFADHALEAGFRLDASRGPRHVDHLRHLLAAGPCCHLLRAPALLRVSVLAEGRVPASVGGRKLGPNVQRLGSERARVRLPGP